MGTAALLKMGFERARLGEPPFPVGADTTGNKTVNTATVEEFLQQAEQQVEALEAALESAWPTMASDLNA